MFFFFRNPFNPDACLAPWGGPVLPDLAMGGFLQAGLNEDGKPRYEKSTAVILTYLVRNEHVKKMREPAMEWEERFVEMMKEYVEKEKPKWMDLAFSSERSIEDELDRSSHSDVVTILVSYIIMFAYIAIALGTVRTWGRVLVRKIYRTRFSN